MCGHWRHSKIAALKSRQQETYEAKQSSMWPACSNINVTKTTLSVETSRLSISLCSCRWKVRKRWKVSFWSSPLPKKNSARPVFIDFRVFPVTAWSRWRIPTLLCDRSTSRTYITPRPTQPSVHTGQSTSKHTGVGTGPADPAAAGPIIW